MIHEIHINVSR